MIKRFPLYKEEPPDRIEHIIDDKGLILHSNINHRNSITGEDIVGCYVSDFLTEHDTKMYYKSIKTCLRIGCAVCTFEIDGKIIICSMQQISSQRVKVTEIVINCLTK